MSYTRTVAIEVTDEDIRLGRRHNATRCPVRRALRRAGVRVHAVFDDGYYFHDEGARMPLPITAANWIRRYDSGADVSPFMFRVGVPA